MKKSFKFVTVVVVFSMLLTAVLLSACSSTTTQPPSSTEANVPASVTAATTKAPATSTEKVNLVYWSMWNQDENQAKAIQKSITEFEAANPNITITVTWNGRQNQTLLRNALAAGTKVDFMDQDSDQVAGGMVAAGQGYSLNDLLTSTALDENAKFESVFTPGVLHLEDLNGTTYLIPYINNPVEFFYNKDIFTKAGITEPQTWDQLLGDCDKIKAAGFTPIAVESDVQLYNAFYFTYLVSRLKGTEWMLQAAADKTGEMWQDPAVLQAANMARDLWTKGCIPDASKGYKWPQGQQTIASGETAMELVGAWLPTELASATAPDFNWGAFPFPAVTGGVGKITDLQVDTLSFMILKDSAHPNEASEFLKFMLTKNSAQEMVNTGLVGTTRVGVDWPVNISEAQKAAENATAVFGEGAGIAASNADYWVKVVRDPFNDMFMGLTTPADFVAKLTTDSVAYWAANK